jgi:hypothetical protein
MPSLARWYIKTALLYLAASLLVGVWIAAGRLLEAGGPAQVLWPGYLHLLTVGWLTQLIFGVAYWLFPRHSKERPYGDTRLPALAYGGLNLGLLLRLVAEPAVVWQPSPAWSGALAASALVQWLAGMTFAVYLWKRVKMK